MTSDAEPNDFQHIFDEENSCNDTDLNIHKIAKVVKVYECTKCDFMHRSYKTLLEHYKIHEVEEKQTTESDDEYEEEIILVCSLCYLQYKSEDEIKEHFINDHGYVRKNVSEEVSEIIQEEKKATSENTPHRNANSNHEEKQIENGDDINNDDDDFNYENNGEPNIPAVPFRELKSILKRPLTQKCPMKGCLYKFATKEKLDSHIKCHISSNSDKLRDFKCYTCCIEIKTWRNCSSHMWKCHEIDIDLFKCPLCSYKAVTTVKIWRHMKVHKRWRTKVLKSLKRNPIKERKDTEQSRWYSQKTCEICSRKFANSKTLSKHVKAVHNKIKPFICNVCGRKSARKSTLIIHMRQHTGEKPLHCKTCSFRASDPSVLKKHELRHKKILQYSCESCEYKSVQSSSLKFHLKTFHPKEYKKLCCDQCTYVSVSSAYLEAHKKDHKKGLIVIEDSLDTMKIRGKIQPLDKLSTNVEISSDCFLPLESTDSITHDPCMDTGGVTIPAHSEDTQFPN